MRRLDRALATESGFAVIWGRRRVGKSRLLIEWSRRRDGLYAVADASAPAVQRRYLSAAVAARFPGFADVEYPDWRSFFERLTAEAANAHWPGPLILDELPYLIAADPTITSVLQNWLDAPQRRPCLIVSGSSHQMMHGNLLDAGAPLYGRASEAFALRPLPPGFLQRGFPKAGLRASVSLHALWGGMPRYWELAQPFGSDLDGAVDTLVLDPAGALHDEPDRLLRAETPPATSLRPLLDVIGAGAHRASEIGGRLGKPVSSLARPLATLVAMNLVRRETPFGSDPKSGKRSLYRIDDPFLRLWFRVVASRRAMLAEAPAETRLAQWYRHRPGLEAMAWEELCRMSVPLLHRADNALARFGPWLPAQRYWHGNNPEFDVVARSADGRRLLVGEVKWTARVTDIRPRPLRGMDVLPGVSDREVVTVLFVPDSPNGSQLPPDIRVLDAGTVFGALHAQA
ncbi:MAG: ATP-binding protein [Gammaproteobacteria bacterium]|nr:ATP-binding protein [Gammaproteobacteria bacterium]